jgi:hypothetical protein
MSERVSVSVSVHHGKRGSEAMENVAPMPGSPSEIRQNVVVVDVA